MLDSLRQAGINIGRELNRTWESLSEGWRELLSRSGNALTHFLRAEEEQKGGEMAKFPRWSLLAGELEESESVVVARIEVPGVEKEDCRVKIEGNLLLVKGEKRLQRESGDSFFHVMERAYGTFERSIVLPHNVDIEKAEASYKSGVLIVRMPKLVSEAGKTITIM